MNEPHLGKADPHRLDHKPITWGAFLTLRKAAVMAANKIQCPVYLVGSALYKEVPRDIDISVIMPLDMYEEMFGKLPSTGLERAHYGEYLQNVFIKSFPFIRDLHFCIDYHLDIKVCPDTWWPDKPKFLLATPNQIGEINMSKERYTATEFQEIVKVSRERIRQWREMGLPYIVVDPKAKRKTFEYTQESINWVEKRRQGRQ